MSRLTQPSEPSYLVDDDEIPAFEDAMLVGTTRIERPKAPPDIKENQEPSEDTGAKADQDPSEEDDGDDDRLHP